MKKILIVLTLLCVAGAAVLLLSRQLENRAARLAVSSPVRIGFSLGTTREERWFKDRDLFIQKAEELGASVSVTLSDYDVEMQISQIENLISQGVSVLVIVPSDSEKIAPAIDAASQAGVRVIAYDRLIKNSDVDLYISFDNIKVGELEAASVIAAQPTGKFAYIGGAPTDNNAFLVKQGSMNILGPKIESGEIELVVDEFMEGWKPDEAYRTIKEYLQTGRTLDAIVAANDGTAFGAIQALKEKGLAGQVPVSGQDAELSACQRIIAGTQTATVYKPISSLAYKAAEIAVDMARGASPATNSSLNNGRREVPAFLIYPILVTKENMEETVIKDGFHSYEDVYQSAPSQ